MSWQKVKLGDVFEFQKKSKVKAGDGLDIGNYKFFTSSVVQTKYLNSFEFKGDSLIMGTGGNASLHFCDSEFTASTDCFVLKPTNKLTTFAKFIYYYLLCNMHILESGFKGAGLKHTSKEHVSQIEIPLPPLDVQKKIADILDKADTLRRKDAELIKKYDELAQSIFIDMFGDPVTNPKGWKVCNFGYILDSISTGVSLNGDDRQLTENDLGVLKISAVTSGFFRNDQYKVVSKNDINRTVQTLKKDDLLFSRANTRELVGATCIVDKDYEYLFLPDKIWKLTLKDSCINVFAKFLLSDSKIRYELNKTATGTSGSMLNISMDKLKSLNIFLPPIDIQYKFSSMINSINKQNGMFVYNNSEQLLQSLLQRAFNGKLVH